MWTRRQGELRLSRKGARCSQAVCRPLQNGASAVLAEQQLVAGQAVEAYPLPALAAWSKLVHPRRSSPRPPGLQAASCCKKSRTPAGPSMMRSASASS